MLGTIRKDFGIDQAWYDPLNHMRSSPVVEGCVDESTWAWTIQTTFRTEYVSSESIFLLSYQFLSLETFLGSSSPVIMFPGSEIIFC